MNELKNQPTFKRQRYLLSFLHQLNSSVSATDLQKLVFLNTMAGETSYYDFVPYKFGPYSFQLKNDLDILHRDGLVTIEFTKDKTRISAVGKYTSGMKYQIACERGDALIRRAYKEYPYYAIRSKITSRILPEKEMDDQGRETYDQAEQVLFTIGYEGKSIEGFMNALIHNDVRLLCDVRKNPQSRKFGFSKVRLKHIAETVGIEYIHIPDLGIESEMRRRLKTLQDYKTLLISYAKMLPSKAHSLEQIFTLLQQNTRIALMCYEQDAEMCHRHIIRDYIVKTCLVRSVDVG